MTVFHINEIACIKFAESWAEPQASDSDIRNHGWGWQCRPWGPLVTCRCWDLSTTKPCPPVPSLLRCCSTWPARGLHIRLYTPKPQDDTSHMAPQQEGIGNTAGTFPSPLPTAFFPGNSAPQNNVIFKVWCTSCPKGSLHPPGRDTGGMRFASLVRCLREQKSRGNTMQTLQTFMLTPSENSAGSVRCVSEKLSSGVFHTVARAECTLLLLKHT